MHNKQQNNKKQQTNNKIQKSTCGMWGSLLAQWYKSPPANAEDTGLIPGPGTKISRALWPKTKT
jgi:hypothetical protein